ncbi:MAG: hypothetical protein EAZ97_10065, partial [Bacteroidetes bacterium]
FLTSCATLNSNTSIQPNENFILGNNKHGSFKVNLKNVSKQELQVYLAPIDGGKHSPQNVKPSQTINVKVDANTALFIVNKSSDTVSVKLKVTGDLGLSMGYGK